MSSRQQSIDFILDHYEHPNHHGPLTEADVVISGGNPGCGDVVTLYLKLDADERVSTVGFEGEGCTISQAAASVLTDKLIGASLAQLAEFDAEPLIDEMGREVVSTRLKCATLAVNLARGAEKQYRTQKTKSTPSV